MAETLITPIILCGGAGSRLWPASRESYPKQFLPLAGAETLLQATVLRVSDPARFTPRSSSPTTSTASSSPNSSSRSA